MCDVQDLCSAEPDFLLTKPGTLLWGAQLSINLSCPAMPRAWWLQRQSRIEVKMLLLVLHFHLVEGNDLLIAQELGRWALFPHVEIENRPSLSPNAPEVHEKCRR